MHLEPRDYQTTAVNETWDYLTKQRGHPLIVLPTGAGKSWVIAMLIERVRAYDGRVLTLAHRKELLCQNHEKIEHLVDEPVGIYSAGLNRRDTDDDVLVAGIQSIYKRADELGEKNMIIVDEAHLISSSEQTMYQQVLDVFPQARVIGLTATPYRTGEGPIAGKDRQFRKISCEVAVEPLMEQGYLSPVIYRPPTQIDTSELRIRGGEFVKGEMAQLFGRQPVVEKACIELAVLSKDRKSILVFCSGISHAEYVREQLEHITGEPVGCVTGDTIPLERSESLRRFNSGELRIMCNCDVLTTGFDNPRIDCVAILRATMSPGLFAQMVGRGFRISPGKENCLVLDFGEDRKRHGDPELRSYGRITGKEPVTAVEQAAAKNGRGRACLNCDADIPAGIHKCQDCGYVIPLAIRHYDTANLDESGIEMRWIVQDVFTGRHNKRNDPEAPPTLRVDYQLREPDSGEGNLAGVGTSASEWVCFEHQGFAMKKAVQWWERRSKHPVPATVDEAAELIDRGACRKPVALITEQDGKWKRVKHVEFSDEKPAVDDLKPGWEPVKYFGEEPPF